MNKNKIECDLCKENSCPKCEGKESHKFKTEQAKSGHMRFFHEEKPKDDVKVSLADLKLARSVGHPEDEIAFLKSEIEKLNGRSHIDEIKEKIAEEELEQEKEITKSMRFSRLQNMQKSLNPDHNGNKKDISLGEFFMIDKIEERKNQSQSDKRLEELISMLTKEKEETRRREELAKLEEKMANDLKNLKEAQSSKADPEMRAKLEGLERTQEKYFEDRKHDELLKELKQTTPLEAMMKIQSDAQAKDAQNRLEQEKLRQEAENARRETMASQISSQMELLKMEIEKLSGSRPDVTSELQKAKELVSSAIELGKAINPSGQPDKVGKFVEGSMALIGKGLDAYAETVRAKSFEQTIPPAVNQAPENLNPLPRNPVKDKEISQVPEATKAVGFGEDEEDYSNIIQVG